MILADFIDLLRAGLPLIIAIGWGLLQVISAMQGGDAKKKPRPPRQPVEPGGEGGKNAELRSEVEEFLRRLKNPGEADDDRPAEPPRKKPRRPRVEVLVDDDSAAVDPRPPRRRVGDSPDRRPPTQQPSRRPADKTVASKQAAGLSERLASDAERLKTQAGEKFDHHLGDLGGQQATADPSTTAAEHAYDEPAYEPIESPHRPDVGAETTPAQQIADMLRDPENVRNAVILNEILTRRS